jgi:signal transduction histidine kinase
MFDSKLLSLAAAALIGVIATAWNSDRSARVIASSVATLDRTREVLLRTDKVDAALVEAESLARAYALTGVPAFRSDFVQAAQELDTSVAALHSLDFVDAAADRPSVTILEGRVARRIALLRELISLRDQNAPQAAVRASAIEGQQVTQMIHEILESVRAEEARLYHSQTAATHSALRFAKWAPWTMGSIALLTFVFMLIRLARARRAEYSARENLRISAALEHAARERAEDADRMKDQFLATLSHELRSPLTAIVGWCDLLHDAKAREALLDTGLASIKDAACIQSRLVEDLLDSSRIAAGKLRLCLAEVDPAEVVDAAIAAIEPAAREKNLTIRKHVDARPPSLSADPARLQQIVGNLLTNSVKFTEAGRAIDVMLEANGSHVRIIVRDEGEGIAPEVLPRVFDRFRQARSLASRQAGLGLGLSIVKNLVELHGGVVRAESDGIGKGATFTVELPVTRPAMTALE